MLSTEPVKLHIKVQTVEMNMRNVKLKCAEKNQQRIHKETIIFVTHKRMLGFGGASL